MTRPSRACKIFLTPHRNHSRQGLRGMGPGAVAPGHGARPGECRARAGERDPAGPHRRGRAGARRLTAPPAASRPPATACARREEPRGAPEASAASPAGQAAASRATRERRWRGPRARTMLWIMTPPPVRAAAHRCRTPTVTARPSVDRSSMCPSHAPWRSPNTAPIAASAAPAPP